jgi:hypothetical protein
VACVGGKWELDSVASEMLVHALAFQGIAAVERPIGLLTERYVDALDLAETDIVCLSYFSRDPGRSARAFCRRLRQRWPGVTIVLALWNLSDAARADAEDSFGADVIALSLDEAVLRIEQALSPENARELRTVPAPENDAARVAALEATAIMDGHARAELDALAARAADVFDVPFAVISAIDADTEVIIGQNVELPGESGEEGAVITFPRADAVCNHVVASDETLVVQDTERDPRFADHPALKPWHARFYAGAPLRTADGLVLGALCLMDTEPRELRKEELDLLRDLAANVAAVITGEGAADDKEDRETEKNSATTGQVVPR